MLMLALAIVFATPTSLPADLAAAQPGDTIVLSGESPAITINRAWAAPGVTIEATGATVRGLTFTNTAAGVIWRGGTIEAPGGRQATGLAGYAVLIRGARDIAIEGATITNADRGMVPDGADGVTVRYVTFTGLRQDGIIASKTRRLTVTHSTFADFTPRPTTCTAAGVVTYGLPSRDCAAQGGIWKDGDHSDAIQFRNGVVDALFGWNVIDSYQGIGQMDTTGDAASERVAMIGNRAGVSGFHSITLGRCIGCSIIGNAVWSTDPTRKTVLRFNAATVRACGNTSRNGGAGLGPC
jgi:hypothetical protein